MPRVVVWLERARPGRSYEIGGIRRVRQGVGGTTVQIAVCVGCGNGVRGAGREQGVVHAKRPEEAILKNSGQRRAFNLFGDETEQRIIGVAIVVFRSRSEDGRMLKCDGEQFVHGPNPGRLMVEAFGKLGRRGIVEQAAPHLKELADGDVAAIGNPGNIFRDRIVETQFPLFDQQYDHGGHHRLGVRGNPKMRIGTRQRRAA